MATCSSHEPSRRIRFDWWSLRCLTVRAAAVLLLTSAIGGASFAAIPRSAGYEQLLDRFFLVRPSDFVGRCRKLSLREAIVIFRVGSHRKALTSGDEFFVVNSPSRLLRGVLTAIVQECPPALLSDSVVLGLLTLDSPIQWRDSFDSTLGIRAPKPLPAQIGSVVPLTDKRERERYLKLVRARIPQKEEINGPDFWGDPQMAVRITLPRSRKEYVFMTVAHFEPGVYQQAGDKALQWTGFLFVASQMLPVLIWQEPGVDRVISVTDLNDDGIYQILTRESGYPSAEYELRLFDGKTLTKPLKTLYQFIH